MAAKKAQRVKTEKVMDDKPMEVQSIKEVKISGEKKFPRWPAIIAGILIALTLYWYKTNTWPVVAVVNNQPIFRYNIVSELYKQGGEQIVDSIITEKLIQQELKNKGIQVTDGEIDEKVNLIKTSLGAGVDLDQALADRGMTMKDLRDQLGLQVGIEKAVSGQVSVSDEEVATYVKENGAYLVGTNDTEKSANARETLTQGKMQEAINTWIESLRANSKVWRVGK